MDTFSDDEGDKAAQDNFINDEAAAGDRQALKDMVRRVREGFGEERGGGRGRGGNARGNLRLDELTRADRSTRGEARRLGLLNRWVAGTRVAVKFGCRECLCACKYWQRIMICWNQPQQFARVPNAAHAVPVFGSKFHR